MVAFYAAIKKIISGRNFNDMENTYIKKKRLEILCKM